MSRCAPPVPGQITYYIPHHSVHHNGKIRVVFDASMKSSNGVSLNDILLVGPTIQAPLFVIFLRFRTFLYAFTADIIKMYRQMWVPDEDRDLQRIVIYENGEIIDCQLNTITYGTSSAPHSAVRSLFQLAEDGKKQFPAAAAVILKNTYIDDTLGGADSLEAVKQVIDELVALLCTAGMELSKWRFSGELAAQTSLCSSSVGRTLGVEWDSEGDFFCFSSLVNFASSDKVLTKRSALSKVSSIFDPLGFSAPVTITGKLLIQELWTDNLVWDEPVSTDFQGRFSSFLSDVAASAALEFPRFVGSSKFSLELHGFSDASKEACSAVIYARIVSGTDPPIVRFIASKTRVAPQKQPRTIPELELCAAALLIELFDPVSTTLGCSPEQRFAYTDSTIVLAYLAKEPGNWTTFVANRVAKIIKQFPSEKWRHVPGEVNPADMATRRKSSAEVEARASLWISGPQFLADSSISFPVPVTTSVSLVSLSASVRRQLPEAQIASFNYVFAPVSRYDRLQRAAAHVFRYVSILTSRIRKQSIPTGPLTIEEMAKAETWLHQIAQACFQEEVTQLRLQQPVGAKSQLRALDPRLYDGVLRVGGRLENSALPFHQKHPIILHSTHRLSILLVRHVHYRYFHSGNRFTANILRSKYWFVGDVTAKVRQCISTCARCIRFSGRPPSIPKMGDLPASRVQSSLPFTHVGVDYAGPFSIRERLRSTRGPARTHKAYWCLFVCMSTKAAHLEVVSELTTAAFLAALQRFVGRRGLPNSITSDNGTNFVGADAELRRQVAALEKDDAVQNYCVSQQVTWKFNPPSAPHMGGIFEALVRSTKYHFKRVVGNQILTFEEMATILIQIEAILNSRPLTPLSSPDETHFEVLTPAHLLIGRPINAAPSDYNDINGLSYSKRWHLLNQLRNSFWRQWAQEYLRTLQKRTKWRSPVSRPIQIDDIVLISDEQSPPLVWPLGRITKLYPGKDGQIRVVDLRTRNGACLQRPVAKLIPFVNGVNE
ncbi:uncharacterized protein LOC135847518 [Planococcus citri]|uniref:uncharacterized protein LOC135847518 n=1 Tax=Planococcus citri TaxID=170843 RepID=UPI0031F7ACD6